MEIATPAPHTNQGSEDGTTEIGGKNSSVFPFRHFLHHFAQHHFHITFTITPFLCFFGLLGFNFLVRRVTFWAWSPLKPSLSLFSLAYITVPQVLNVPNAAQIFVNSEVQLTQWNASAERLAPVALSNSVGKWCQLAQLTG
jgi:hypothetical protein